MPHAPFSFHKATNMQLYANKIIEIEDGLWYTTAIAGRPFKVFVTEHMILSLILFAVSDNGGAGSTVSDQALVKAAKRGDSQAFATLHARYYSRIYRLAYLKTNNASDAEDVASETFLRAFASLPRFDFKGPSDSNSLSFYPWLHRIAINLIVDTNRHRPQAQIVSLDAPLIAGMRDLLSDRLSDSDESVNPQDIVERNEVQELVRSAIASMPQDYGEVLIYRFLGELSLKEIAQNMDRSESAIKSLLHRAVVNLRSDISKRLDSIERHEIEAHRQSLSQTTIKKEVVQHVGRRLGEIHRSKDG